MRDTPIPAISADAAATALECLEDLCLLAYGAAPADQIHHAIAGMVGTITGWESTALLRVNGGPAHVLACTRNPLDFASCVPPADLLPGDAFECIAPDGSTIAARRLAGPWPEPLLVAGVVPNPPIGDEEVGVLKICARVARQTLRMAQMQLEARRARATTQHLVDAGISLSSKTTLEDVLARMVGVAQDVLEARYAAMAVLNHDHTAVEQFYTSGLTPEEIERIGPPPTGRGILGTLIKDPRPIRIPDIQADPRSCGVPDGHPTMRSFLGVPVMLRGEVFGNLYVAEKIGADEFSEADLRLAQTLASQAAVAVDNARRYQTERQRVAELNSLQEVTQAIHATLDLDELLPLIARRARTLTGADRISISLRGADLTFEAADGDEAVDEGEASGEVATVAGEREGTAVTRRSEQQSSQGHWVVVEPLEIGGDPVGTLTAFSRTEPHTRARRLLSTLASQASLAVANANAFATERARLRESARVAAADARASAAADGLRKAIELQEAERARVARELHDEAGQSLTALALNMRALDRHLDDAGRAELAQLRQMVNNVSANLRAIAVDLRPSGLREHGLTSAIQRQGERLRASSGIAVDLALDELPDDLPQEVQIAVYRVVQEALTNIARHSEATHVSVLARHRQRHLRIMVEDDGCGFDPSLPTDRLGLRGMRERTELLGGTLSIESRIGAGTAVIVDLEVGG